jgi:hypothetical protein
MKRGGGQVYRSFISYGDSSEGSLLAERPSEQSGLSAMNLPQVGKALAVAAVATFAASNAFAANDGSLGATSQGDLDITLTIDPLVQISALDDIALGNYTGGANMTGADDLCVYSNTGGYDITASGNGGGSAFELIGGSVNIPYTVEWADTAGAGTGSPLTSGTALTGQGGTFSTPDCGGVDNARVIVTVNSTDLAAAPADNYIGVLTLLVAPQ